MNDLLSIGLWNVEWASRTDRGHFFVPRLAELSRDVLCVTEGNADLCLVRPHIFRRRLWLFRQGRSPQSSALESDALERSRHFRLITTSSRPLVAGTTTTPLGEIRFIGVCIRGATLTSAPVVEIAALGKTIWPICTGWLHFFENSTRCRPS